MSFNILQKQFSVATNFIQNVFLMSFLVKTRAVSLARYQESSSFKGTRAASHPPPAVREATLQAKTELCELRKLLTDTTGP